MRLARALNLQASYDFSPGTPDQQDALSSKKAMESGELDPEEPSSNAPTPMIRLSRGRFMATVLLSLSVFLTLLLVFLHGIVIDTKVRDELGSSKHVDEWVERYQVINGYVTAAFGMAMESYFAVFAAVATMFLSNVRLFPGDDPRVGRGRVKTLLVLAMPQVLLFLLNVAISAMFVSHQTTGVVRVFLQEDLIATTALGAPALNATALPSPGNTVSVLDTILRGVVRQRVAPFQVDKNSRCFLNTNASDEPIELPSVKEIRSTAVVYGFPALDWHGDALPFGLLPTHSVVFDVATNQNDSAIEDFEKRFADFQKQANVSWLTIYEIFLQGKMLYERSVSDSNVSATYPCVQTDGRADLDESVNGSRRRLRSHRRRGRVLQADDESDDDWKDEDDEDEDFDVSDYVDIFEDGPNKGKRRCYGANSSLPSLANMADPQMHSMDSFLSVMIDGIINTTTQIEPESMNLTIETFEINPELSLTSMTLDMPYYGDREYRNTSEDCDGAEIRKDVLDTIVDSTTTESDLEHIRQVMCSQDYFPFERPRSTCGSTNCIFLDESGTISFKKQLQLMPYLTNCNTTKLDYSADYLNFFPRGCKAEQENAVFLYGLGSYMAGDSFDSGYDSGLPLITKPRRHVVLTFAKLEWRLQDLSAKFDAKCGANSTSGCSGLLHDLENTTVPSLGLKKGSDVYKRVLVLGKDQLPADLRSRDFRNPVQLATLNSPPFYYKTHHRYYEWEYLNLKHFQSDNWSKTIQDHGGLDGELCSPFVDAYIAQLEANHWFMDDPRQPLYTSALFYLFQNAAVKSVKSVKVAKNATTDAKLLALSMIGTTTLKGDLERHEITFKIPLLSLISTFLGLAAVLALTALVILRPKQRFKMSEDAEESATQQYLRFHQEDEYPREVFDRGLKLSTGERVVIDDYVVDSLTLHHVRDEDKKMYL